MFFYARNVGEREVGEYVRAIRQEKVGEPRCYGCAEPIAIQMENMKIRGGRRMIGPLITTDRPEKDGGD